jgi:hypothetical protein
MEDGVVAERFGAKRVLADSFKMRPKGEFAAPQQQQEGGREDGGAKIVNQILPVITTPRALSLTRLGPSCNASGNLSGRPRHGRPEGCEANTLKGVSDRRRPMAKKIGCTRSEKRPIARARAAGDELYHKRAPVRPYRVERETNAVGTHAEERHIRERHGARITRNRS